MPDITLESLATEIRERITALETSTTERLSDAKLEENIRQSLTNIIDSDDGKEFVRKIRFGASGADELVGTKYARFGLTVADVEWLHDVLSTAQKRGLSSGPSEELTRTFEACSQGRYLDTAMVRAHDQKALEDLFSNLNPMAFYGRDREMAARGGWQDTEAFTRAVRAMDTAETGFGLELIGAQYVGELWRGARADSRVLSLIPTFEMTAPTSYIPVEAGLPEMLFVAESTANNSSNYDTSKTGSERVQVDAKKFVIHQMWSGEMEEDSIIPFIPFLREEATRSLAHYGDSLVINGDTTNAGTGNINLDDADPADTKHYLAADGIRHVGLVDNTGNQDDIGGVALTFNDLFKAKGRMLDTTRLHDWGHPTDPNDLVYVADPESVDAISQLDEILTVDKYGSRATVLNGEQANVMRHPLISSQAVSKTEADGKVSTTGSNNTLGQVVPFNRRAFRAGWRRRIQVETERLPATDQNRIVYSLRVGFGRFSPTGAASGIEGSDVLFNIGL